MANKIGSPCTVCFFVTSNQTESIENNSEPSTHKCLQDSPYAT